MTDLLGAFLVLAGICFYAAGSIGLIRLPDIYSRLHALTKADNLGLGLLVSGISLISFDVIIALKLFLVWLLVMLASAVSAHMIAQQVLRQERE